MEDQSVVADLSFMDEWKISYNRLCHYVYTGEELEVLNKETKKSRKMTIELPADGSWECVVKYEQKNNTAKRYQIRKCI